MATLLKYKKGLKRPTLAWNEFAIRYTRIEREHYKTIKVEKRDRAPPLLRPKLHTGGSVAGSVGRVAPRSRRHELLSLWGSSFLH